MFSPNPGPNQRRTCQQRNSRLITFDLQSGRWDIAGGDSPLLVLCMVHLGQLGGCKVGVWPFSRCEVEGARRIAWSSWSRILPFSLFLLDGACNLWRTNPAPEVKAIAGQATGSNKILRPGKETHSVAFPTKLKCSGLPFIETCITDCKRTPHQARPHHNQASKHP